MSERFVVVCTSGFNNIAKARSALMFATLASAAEYRTVLYCVQDGVDIMCKGAIQAREKPTPGVPTLAERLAEAIAEGVEILCCSQTLANKGISESDLIEEAKVSGAMTLIELVTEARGTLCF